MASSSWQIGPISTPSLGYGAVRGGRQHKCGVCGLLFFTGERAGFCCGPNGNRFELVPPLPPLPPNYNTFINHEDISKNSRILNLVFSFASLESTHPFPDIAGDRGFVAIQGKVYHRVRPNHQNSAVRWLLHDGFLMNKAPFPQWASVIPDAWKNAFKDALVTHNPFVHAIRNLSLLDPIECSSASLILQDAGAAEIAAIMVYDNTSQSQISPRSLQISRLDGRNWKIPTVSRMWEPLAYPLLFPHGTPGWGLSSPRDEILVGATSTADADTPTTQMWHYRRRLLSEERFSIFGRLTNEYLVDMFTRDLESRLAYIRRNQARIRAEDAELMGVELGDLEGSDDVFLPASFLGSNSWASDQIADSLAIAAAYGPPTFFITMTCNPDCPEIRDRCRPGQRYTDIPLIVVRVFKLKLQALLQCLKSMFPALGKPVYLIYSIEFQKRGLPHAHILVRYNKECITAADIDAVISAEMPSNPADKELVTRFMLHNHPLPELPPSKYCQKVLASGARQCRFRYPFDVRAVTSIDPISGYANYRRRSEGDAMVVPHCLPILRKFQCHINWEVAGSSQLFQYLFKYIHKGPDTAKYRVQDPNPGAVQEPVDEIEDFWRARYLSAGEAAWRIMGFNVTRKEPAVSSLPVHLPTSHSHHQYQRRSGNASTLSRLDRYFLRPDGDFTINDASRSFKDLTYVEYNTLFRFQGSEPTTPSRTNTYVEKGSPNNVRQFVILRDSANVHIARIRILKPTHGDVYYLRLLLLNRPALSFIDARTINGVVFDTYQQAAVAAGLFNDATEGLLAMKEAIETLRTPRQVRLLFVHLLVNNCVQAPRLMWDEFEQYMSRDFYIRRNGVTELAINDALNELGCSLEEFGKSLSDFALPQPTIRASEVEHELQRWGGDEMRARLEERAEEALNRFTEQQRELYERVMDAVADTEGFCLYVAGKAGTGKTTVVKAICDMARSKGHIVIATASSAFAAQLYPGGQTAHHAFKVPVNDRNEFLTSTIDVNSTKAQLIAESSLIILDEVSMLNQAVLACIDDICRRIMRVEEPFGGKNVVLLGDFRQTCPVIRRGTRAQVVAASVKSSPLWHHFETFHLTQPIRNAEDPDFANFVNSIGDGAGPNISLQGLNTTTNIDELIQFAFPDGILAQPRLCISRAILAPKNDQVDLYNGRVLQKIDTAPRTYMAADSVKEVEDAGLFPPEPMLDFARKYPPPGIPSQTLVIKVGAVYRLMRNLSIDRMLVKNVRVVVINTGPRLITIRILKPEEEAEPHPDNDVLLPRITFESTLSSGHTMMRLQFPLAPAYATTFNSCQGLTLDRVAVDLTYPVFSHGQLYTAMSRIRNRTHATFRVHEGQDTTLNVTYEELLL